MRKKINLGNRVVLAIVNLRRIIDINEPTNTKDLAIEALMALENITLGDMVDGQKTLDTVSKKSK